MRYLFFFVAISGTLLFSGCDNMFKKKKMNTGTMNNNATPDGSNSDEMPDIRFDNDNYDFGTIEQGEVIKFSLKFTNTGKADLLINNCKASCGCTVPNWPKDRIRPGESAYIDVEFDSHNKQNELTKEIDVSTNCVPAVRKVKFHGFVRVPEKK